MRFHNWQLAIRLSNGNETNENETTQYISLSLCRSLSLSCSLAATERRSRCQDDWKAHTAARVPHSTTFQAGLVSVPVSFRSVLVRFSKRRRGRAVRRESNKNLGNAVGATQLPFAVAV